MIRNNSHLRSEVPFAKALSTIGAALPWVGNVSFTLSPLRYSIGASVIHPISGHPILGRLIFGSFHFGAYGYVVSAEEAV